MYLIVLFIIIFAVGINGAWLDLPTSVHKDAIELTRLTEEFWSLKPTVFESKGPLVLCQFINECCATEKHFQAISVMVSSIINEYRSKNRYATILNVCINSTTLEEASQSCPLINKLISPSITVQDKSIILQYKHTVMNYFTELNSLINHMHKSCNHEEIHAFLCLSNTKLVKTCAQKILQEIYEHGDYKIYQKFIVETKQILTHLNQQLSHLSIKNTNTD